MRYCVKILKKYCFKNNLNFIRENDLTNNVLILGYVSNSAMVALYQNALATTFVSLLGPTNIPPMEALTLGSPLICSNAYGMPEQVGDCALLINPKNPVDIANKIEYLFYNENIRIDLVEKGKVLIESYGPKNFSDKLEGILNDLL